MKHLLALGFLLSLLPLSAFDIAPQAHRLPAWEKAQSEALTRRLPLALVISDQQLPET